MRIEVYKIILHRKARPNEQSECEMIAPPPMRFDLVIMRRVHYHSYDSGRNHETKGPDKQVELILGVY